MFRQARRQRKSGTTLRPSAQQVDFPLPGWKLLLVGVVTGTPKFQLTLFCPRAGIFASSSSAPWQLASPHTGVCNLPCRPRSKAL